MKSVSLRKVVLSDIKYFFRWWRDKNIIALTSGDKKPLPDKKIREYFRLLYERDGEYMMVIGKKVIGHVSLVKRKNKWYETQIIIGDKKERGKGYGVIAIKKLLQKVAKNNISNIYLEVRPNNLRAIRAYEKCGFVAVKVINYPRNKDLPQTIRMELI